ncbi:MAG: hypothetical protein E3J73_04320 [Candidatus Bathyarchaeum sp.]|nr:MAG: hypothetical protein E3J73_04320 [Candidatus Bathyarchaeum sp.]
MSIKDISDKLSKKIDKRLTAELLKEYRMTKRHHYLEDWEKSILHAGKFSEVTLAVIKSILDKEVVDINNIRFDPLYQSVSKRKRVSAEDELLTLAIPTTAKSIYNIRNKKRVAHVKAIDPDILDSQYCASACDWILAEFVMLYLRSNPKTTGAVLCSLVEKKVPFVEQFEDGSLLVLKEGMTFKEEFLVALYQLGGRVVERELTRVLKKYAQLIHTTARNLEKDRLVHINRQGVKLTRKGIKFVEDKLLSTH